VTSSRGLYTQLLRISVEKPRAMNSDRNFGAYEGRRTILFFGIVALANTPLAP
jgi:hypothetical protein